MKKIIAAALILMLLLTGCDMHRKISELGAPKSTADNGAEPAAVVLGGENSIVFPKDYRLNAASAGMNADVAMSLIKVAKLSSFVYENNTFDSIESDETISEDQEIYGEEISKALSKISDKVRSDIDEKAQKLVASILFENGVLMINRSNYTMAMIYDEMGVEGEGRIMELKDGHASKIGSVEEYLEKYNISKNRLYELFREFTIFLD